MNKLMIFFLITMIVASQLPSLSLANKLEDGLDAMDKGDTKKGIDILYKEFQKGNSTAGFYLGRISELGLGIPVNLPQAIQFYKKAGDEGNSKALNRMGIMHYDGGGVLQDYVKGHELICKAANLKDVEGQFNCAASFLEGKGVKRNIKQAEKYFLMAAKQEYVGAMNLLANNYATGGFGEKRIKKSIFYYKKTAAKGSAIGLYNLGLLLEEGVHLPKDLIKAHMYYNLASARQHAKAANHVASITKLLTAEKLAKAQSLAATWQVKNK